MGAALADLAVLTCREYMAGRRREARASGVALGATLTKLSGQD